MLLKYVVLRDFVVVCNIQNHGIIKKGLLTRHFDAYTFYSQAILLPTSVWQLSSVIMIKLHYINKLTSINKMVQSLEKAVLGTISLKFSTHRIIGFCDASQIDVKSLRCVLRLRLYLTMLRYCHQMIKIPYYH